MSVVLCFVINLSLRIRVTSHNICVTLFIYDNFYHIYLKKISFVFIAGQEKFRAMTPMVGVIYSFLFRLKGSTP